MRISKIKSFLVLMAVVLSGCSESWLELEPRTQTLETDFYQTEDQIFEAVVATYDVLQWGGFGGYTQIEMISDILSDEAHCGGGDANDQPQLQSLENFSMNPNMSPDGLWGKFYQGIYAANTVIGRIDDVETWEKQDKDRLLAEAHFLRAYYYYQLWRFYGKVPLILEVLNPGDAVEQLEPDAIYAFIVAELDNDVIGKLPTELEPYDLGRATNGAAVALKARIVLYQNDETKMAEIASELETLIGAGTYALESDLDYVFSNVGEYCSESVFEINHTEARNWGDWGWLAGGEGNMQPIMTGIRGYSGDFYDAGWGFSPVSVSLSEAFDNDDLRKEATIIDPVALGASFDEGYQNTGLFQKKYAPRVGETHSSNPMLNFNNNVRVIRYSDVLLMAAEAIIRSGGNLANAQNYYDAVRDRAFGDTAHRKTLSLNAAGLELLYTERHLEFALEGLRFWDLVRTGEAETVLSPLGYTSKNRYLPIPQSEIDKASGMLEQNEGYN